MRKHERLVDRPTRRWPVPSSQPCSRPSAAAVALAPALSADTWRGLTVAPEHRCSPYDKKRDYPYPQSVEQAIVRALGAVHGPYTGTCFRSTSQTNIEHVVAASEAHNSGLCAAEPATRRRFAQVLRNLTLASPGVNRHQKSGKDAGDWLPEAPGNTRPLNTSGAGATSFGTPFASTTSRSDGGTRASSGATGPGRSPTASPASVPEATDGRVDVHARKAALSKQWTQVTAAAWDHPVHSDFDPLRYRHLTTAQAPQGHRRADCRTQNTQPT